jgi:hypothetical protein
MKLGRGTIGLMAVGAVALGALALWGSRHIRHPI